MTRPEQFRFAHLASPGSIPGDVGAASEGPLVEGTGVGFPQAHDLGRSLSTPPGAAPTAGETESAAVSPALLPEHRLQPCCGAMSPEHGEGCRLVAQVTDRRGPRYISPLGAQRERARPCPRCGDPDVWALYGLCDRCELDARTRTLAHLDEPAREAMLR